MSYNIHFVGLVCFNRFADGLNVLLPNGNSNGSTAHGAALIAHPRSVYESEWWGDPEIHDEGIFPIVEKTSLTFSGTGGPGDVRLEEYRYLPNLRSLDPKFRLREDPNTIATARLTNGTLTVFKHPNEDATAFVSTFFVQHDGMIRVEGKGGKFIRFRAGSDIAVANVEDEYLNAVRQRAALKRDYDDLSHFQIYYELAEDDHGTELSLPRDTGRPHLNSGHPVFGGPLKILTLKIGCSNTGCC